jgi:hypothetical protein
MSIIEIGCCGTYCETCPAFAQHTWKGCNLGYEIGVRDLSKAKCQIKLCCIGSHLQSCADCQKLPTSQTVNDFYQKPGLKYGKYIMEVEYIRNHGYDSFWKSLIHG